MSTHDCPGIERLLDEEDGETVRGQQEGVDDTQREAHGSEFNLFGITPGPYDDSGIGMLYI